MKFTFEGTAEEWRELFRRNSITTDETYCYTTEPTETEETAWPDGCPKPGERFTHNGREYVALDIEQGGLVAITANPIAELPFDAGNSNDWRTSTLRKYLNSDFLNEVGEENLFTHTSDLTADDGRTDYGTAEDYVSLLSDAQYRKYRDLIPNMDTWWWTITPWSTYPSYGSLERVVYATGALNDNLAYSSFGVVPRLLFNLSIFKDTHKPCDSRAT